MHIRWRGMELPSSLEVDRDSLTHLCQKAFKSLNLLRYISSKPWGQDTSVLIHLATALVRS